MNGFKANKKQVAAFNRVVAAIRSANKSGLVFYGKCGSLVAYTKYADDYVDENGFEKCLQNGHGNGQIDHLSASILQDSGADDFPNYINYNDNPDNN